MGAKGRKNPREAPTLCGCIADNDMGLTGLTSLAIVGLSQSYSLTNKSPPKPYLSCCDEHHEWRSQDLDWKVSGQSMSAIKFQTNSPPRQHKSLLESKQHKLQGRIQDAHRGCQTLVLRDNPVVSRKVSWLHGKLTTCESRAYVS